MWSLCAGEGRQTRNQQVKNRKRQITNAMEKKKAGKGDKGVRWLRGGGEGVREKKAVISSRAVREIPPTESNF